MASFYRVHAFDLLALFTLPIVNFQFFKRQKDKYLSSKPIEQQNWGICRYTPRCTDRVSRKSGSGVRCRSSLPCQDVEKELKGGGRWPATKGGDRRREMEVGKGGLQMPIFKYSPRFPCHGVKEKEGDRDRLRRNFADYCHDFNFCYQCTYAVNTKIQFCPLCLPQAFAEFHI